jgi:predicted dehydrogenase
VTRSKHAGSAPDTGAKRSIGVGVVGLGLMGRVHIESYAKANVAGQPCTLVAVSDRSADRLDGRIAAQGNLQKDTASARIFDPSVVHTSTDPHSVFEHAGVELVSICTPTDTHVELAIAALAAGKHVLLEKPVSLDAGEIERLDFAAKKARRICMPAMCMRFWPGWSWLKEAISDRRYGAVLSASFQRCASRPAWGQGFYADPSRSGGALFDLHVHDADLVRWLFGDPDSVSCTGSMDHVTTLYRYARGPAHVAAEGGWDHADGFPFRMRYVVVFESATAEFDLRREKPLEITRGGAIEAVAVSAETGYDGEIRHILGCVREGRETADATLAESAAVTRLLLAEKHDLHCTRSASPS